VPKTLAVVPVYNEEKNLGPVLRRLAPRVDFLLFVNDGSTDGSLALLRSFAKGRKGTYVLDLPHNTGMAGALKQGFLFALYLKEKKILRDEDLVVTIDADGQHKPEYIPALVKYMVGRKADVVLTRRDFSVYPLYKKLGNRFLTWTNRILSGVGYHDVESGLRLLRVKTLAPILRYYTGVKYSCAQEIALISAKAGFKIDNDFLVEIAYYRAGTTLWDGFIVLFMSLLAYGRWRLGIGREARWEGVGFERAYQDSLSLWRRGSKGPRRR